MPKIENKIGLKSGDVVSYSVESVFSDISISELSKYQSIKNIKDIIDRNTIFPRFRIFVLNDDETVCYQIPNEDIISGGSYQENYQNGSRRTLSFSLYNDDGKYTPSINKFWVNTKVRLDIGLEVPDERITIWFNHGVFLMSAPNPSHSSDGSTVSINCADKFTIFENSTGIISTTTEIPPGSKIKDVIQDIQNIDLGNGSVLDPIPMFIDPTFEESVVQQTISLSAGQTYGEMLKQLSNMISAEIFYDSTGVLTIAPIVELMNDGDKPVLYDYEAGRGNLQNDDFSLDVDSFVNSVQVIGSNINGRTVTALAENTDPSSPLSIDRIGRRSLSPITDTNITTDVLAQERADYELRQRLIAKSTLNSNVFFNPLLGVNNLVTYTDEFYGLRRDRFLIQSISFSLNYDGMMSLSVSNINNLPFVIG